MTQLTSKLAPATEIILGMVTTGLGSVDRAAITSNPRGFLLERTDVYIDDSIDLKIVKNNAEIVHLALPYYDYIASHSVEALEEADMLEVAGGEVVTHLEKQGINMLKEGIYKDGGLLNGAHVVGHALAERQRRYILETQGLMPREKPNNNASDDVYSDKNSLNKKSD